MNSVFFESSKATANDFLQSIVFIDDESYTNDQTDHNLNASEISKVFAKRQKICSVYNPTIEADISDLVSISKKSDIVVVDWKIDLAQEVIVGDENADVQEDDPRGVYTVRIIKEILLDPVSGPNSLKLITVYTGETDLKGITDEIFNQLKDQIPELQKENFEVFTKNFKIVIIGKPSLIAKHIPEVAARIKTYEELPDFILNEFTKLTSGLVSDFVLNALTLIRGNIFRLITLFNKNIDAAFLSHRSLLSDPEDSKDQLVELLSHSINALLNYSKAGNYVSDDRINKWIDSNTFSEVIIVAANKEISVDREFLKQWLSQGFGFAIEEKCRSLNYTQPSKNKLDELQKNLYKSATRYFSSDGKHEIKDCEFSILTHQKSNIRLPVIPPKLTLGTIVKQNIGNQHLYYVCIQQRCDSVRLTDERRFLFLPLMVVTEGKFHFVIAEGPNFIKLKIEDASYNLRTIKFKPDENGKFPITRDNEGVYHFTSVYGEDLIWLSDLKDAHAQRIANNYAAKLARVGLDESEWLRRWAT